MLKFALVGCGRISKRHSELLGNGQIQGATLAAVCDVVPAKADAVAKAFGAPAYIDMHEMMHREQPDVVVVLTESGRHAEHVIALAPYGKHLVVEKPMALTLDDADAMIKACDMHGVRLFVVKQNRFNVPVVKLREALEAGRFGRMVLGTVRVRWCRRQDYYDQDPWRGTWALDGGVLTNQASHHVDLLEWMMGDVESVFAKSMTALVDIEAEDTAVVLLKFRSGALGLIEATTATRPKGHRGLDLYPGRTRHRRDRWVRGQRDESLAVRAETARRRRGDEALLGQPSRAFMASGIRPTTSMSSIASPTTVTIWSTGSRAGAVSN